MKRRGFLQAILGAAVLTAAQRSAVEREIASLPTEPEPTPGPGGVVERAFVDGIALRLNWREAVDHERDLPADADECDAMFVGADDTIRVYVEPVGWVRMASAMPDELRTIDRTVDSLLAGWPALGFTHAAAQHPTSEAFVNRGMALSHVVWLLEELRSNAELRADIPKASRWLGSAFGILIGVGYVTIDDARNIVAGAKGA